MRKFLPAILAVFAALAGFVFLVGMGIFLAYGPPGNPQLPGVKIEEKNRIISFNSETSAARQGVIIYPANLVSPWQYQDIAAELAHMGQRVFILDPSWRFTSFGPQILGQLQELNPDIKQWILIGNSAGASLACKDKAANPHIYSEVIVVNGYCKNLEFKPKLAIFGSDDRFIRAASHASQAQRSETVEGGHFILTDRNKSRQGHAQAIYMILQLI